MKPPNYLIVPGIVLAYLLARRWREGAIVALAVVPSLLALTAYKERGARLHPAVRPRGGPPRARRGLWRRCRRRSVHRHQLRPLARADGPAARVRRGARASCSGRRSPACWPSRGCGFRSRRSSLDGSPPSSSSRDGRREASIEANTMWRLLMPAWPAYLLLAASIPTSRADAGAPARRPRRGRARDPGRRLAAADRHRRARRCSARVLRASCRSSTTPRSCSARSATRSCSRIRDPSCSPSPTREPNGSDPARLARPRLGLEGLVPHLPGRLPRAATSTARPNQTWAIRCILEADLVGQTSETTWVDPNPTPEAVYRIGVAVRYDGEDEGRTSSCSRRRRSPVPPSS